MKIKTKKQLNLPQLIEWVWENDVRCRTFIANDKHIPGKVNFDENGMIDIQTTVGNDETFTVEEEIEITEDTVIDKLVVIDSDNDALVFSNYTIKEIKDNGFKEFHAYIDGEFKLIWTHDKGLVE
ncbi:hypothetical protein QOK74_08120 [Staphylococcus saprophyticus]|uniref:hypothetical protein n=1 Tax=Staphylococcus saprophyticus TaxID=29385 RepID=UPI0024C34126|nr:hypothetical protein [Staphylococcus saprophyticus]MDK1672836.1 hypothetical protein [Staphylococcus saprophyticus]